jgi:type IV secretory pathway TrbL component
VFSAFKPLLSNGVINLCAAYASGATKDAKGKVHGVDPAFNVMERMRRRQTAEEAAAAAAFAAAGGVVQVQCS